MNVVWGVIIAVLGVLLIAAATVRTPFLPYRMIVARSRLLWGGNVYGFHQVAGLVMVVFGILYALGIIGG